jgi:two-component system, sensor histidine kinase ChiS
MKILLRTFLFGALAITAACTGKTSVLNVDKGHIDLTQFAFSADEIYELNGKWQYFPGKLIAPEELGKNTAVPVFAPVPQSFSSYADTSLRLPAAASATYRLVIDLPAKVQAYTVRIPPPATACRVFVNGHLEFQNGIVSENPSTVGAQTRMRYMQLPLAGKTDLLIQVSNAEFRKGGIWQAISLGTAAAMERYRLHALISDILVIVALLTFAVYHILLSYLKHPETSSIYYGLFCLMVAVGRLFTGERLVADVFPGISWAVGLRIEFVCNFIDAGFFYLYYRLFFPDLSKSIVVKAFGTITLAFALAAAVLPISVTRHLREPFQIIIALGILFGLFQLIRLAFRNVYGARIFLAGIVAVALGFGNDALKSAEVISTPYLFSYSILLFTLIQAILISGKSVAIFRENAELSKKLMHSDKLKDEFLTQTSHELRTPVQAMVQTLENLRRGVTGAVSEQVQKTLAVIEENGRRLLFLIDDLTDFVRLKHNDVRLNLQTVALKKIIDPIMKLCLGLSENKQLALIDEIPDGLDDVRVDPARIQQIMLNLLNTAIRYAHSPAITVKLGSIDAQLAVSVFYNGADPDAHYTHETEGDGDEVGPLVTQRLAELMGGKYYYHKFAESQHSLSITIPYDHIDALQALIAHSKHRTEYRKTSEKTVYEFPVRMTDGSSSTGTSVLIVGDNASQNRLLQEQLVSLGKLTRSAKNGAEAMLLLQGENDVSLIICDVLLSDVSGIELTMNIRAHYDIGLMPLILIIDNNQTGVAASAFAAGVNDLIRRPFEKAEVVARVRNVLLQREASLARENYRALNRELEIARTIQESILPISQPKSSHYKIEAVCMPARSIGGDFYDFIEDETSVCVLIADVAGHGIPAALYASMLKIAFHNLRDQAKFPEKLLKELNDVMVDRGERTFISCAYTMVDFKNKRLLHANAGHLPLLLQEPGKPGVKKIQPPGGVLGVRKAAAITVEMHHLRPKTRLTLFTDGVIELVNRKGDFFEEERLIAILEEMRESTIAELKERLLADMRAFAEGETFLDDVTFVILDV